MIIRAKEDLEEAAMKYGILPFFRNNIKGFSIEEMTPSSLLFGGLEYEGCWEWKGPVVRKRSTAYGKFFRRKAGFVSRELLPYFLQMRRSQYPMKIGSTEEMLFDIISVNDRITSTLLRQSLIGTPLRRTAFDLPEAPSDIENYNHPRLEKPSRHSLEAPLQRLQMGGWICISDFQYKKTRQGDRYGWGVAEYSTPESIFPDENLIIDLPAEECAAYIIDFVASRFPQASSDQLRKLLK